jgi:hypothetical protein
MIEDHNQQQRKPKADHGRAPGYVIEALFHPDFFGGKTRNL